MDSIGRITREASTSELMENTQDGLALTEWTEAVGLVREMFPDLSGNQISNGAMKFGLMPIL